MGPRAYTVFDVSVQGVPIEGRYIYKQLKVCFYGYYTYVQCSRKNMVNSVILLQFPDSESWDSSYDKSWVPVKNQWVPVQKTMSPYSYIERCHITLMKPDYHI